MGKLHRNSSDIKFNATESNTIQKNINQYDQNYKDYQTMQNYNTRVGDIPKKLTSNNV